MGPRAAENNGPVRSEYIILKIILLYYIEKMSVHVVTVSNKSGGYYDILKESCIKHGCELTTLGYGEKWGGFVWRFKKIQEYLNTVNPDDIIIIVDGFDVVMTENIETVMKKYRTFGKNIVIGVTYDCDLAVFMSKRFFGLVKYNDQEYVINAGLYIGKCEKLLEMYKLIDDKYGFDNYKDDQLLMTKFMKDHVEFMDENIALDTKSTMFNNAVYVDFKNCVSKSDGQLNIYYENGNILNKFKKPSSFLHGPGNVNLKLYIEKLGYSNVPDIPKYSNDRTSYYAKLFISGMFWYDWIIVFMVLIIVIFTIVMIIYARRSVSQNKRIL